MTARRLPLLLPAVLIAGCRGEGRLMPLAVGKEWTYSVYNGYGTTIEPIRVEGRVPVGPVEGYRLGGPMGASSLGWSGDVLLASRTANASFDPPVPLGLDRPLGPKALVATWRGTVEAFGRKRLGTGTLTQLRDRLTLGGEGTSVARADLMLRLRDGTTVELATWFRPGDGIVKQEQRTNRRHVVTLLRMDAG